MLTDQFIADVFLNYQVLIQEKNNEMRNVFLNFHAPEFIHRELYQIASLKPVSYTERVQSSGHSDVFSTFQKVQKSQRDIWSLTTFMINEIATEINMIQRTYIAILLLPKEQRLFLDCFLRKGIEYAMQNYNRSRRSLFRRKKVCFDLIRSIYENEID